MRVYLDACCLNRPFDDPRQERIRFEAEAIAVILARCERGELILVGSEVLVLEVLRTPDIHRREAVLSLCGLFTEVMEADDWIRGRATELLATGFHLLDALHVACAEKAHVDVFLSVDDDLLKRRHQSHVPVANPLEWLLARKDCP